MPFPEKNSLPAEGPADGIRIDGLRLSAVLGVFPEERAAPREVVAYLRIGVDLAAAARSDDLRDTVDWGVLCARLRGCAAARPYNLAESLAGALADVALEDPRVAWVRLRLEKPGALPGVDSLSVCIFRERGRP